MTVKKTLEELLDSLGPEELDSLLPENFDSDVPEGALGRMEDRVLEQTGLRAKKIRRLRRPWVRAAIAACLVLALGLGGFAAAAEAKEYSEAVEFFAENGLSTEGLSRADVKAVFRDITTESFTNDKTAQVLERSVPGWEISQKEPTPEELAAAWDRNVWRNAALGAGIRYRTDCRYAPNEALGRDVFDRSFLECYRDGALLWTAEFSSFYVEDSTHTSAGTAVWGYRPSALLSGGEAACPWLARVDEGGAILWQRRLVHGFSDEYIAAVLDNGDGTWAVLSRGDLRFLCLSQYDMDGNELSFHLAEVGNAGIWSAARLGDGYLVQLGHRMDGQTARVVKLDREGNVIDDLTYAGEDCDYTITGMIEFGDRAYLSAYAVPKQTDEGGRHEIANILDYLFDNGIMEIPSEELTPVVRDNYTAVLLVCGPEGGAPETFYSVKGSLGGKLAVNGAGELEWDVESVTSTFFSPATSSFTIGGTCQVFRYTFDAAGTLARQEDTGETTPYRR